MTLWIRPPEGWPVDARAHEFPNAEIAVSNETRSLEFEVSVPDDAAPGEHAIDGYALYNVCEGLAGRCLYRRMDIEIRVTVRASAER